MKVGAPIAVNRSESPTEEEVNLLHQKYQEKLIELFEMHKHALHGANALRASIQLL